VRICRVCLAKDKEFKIHSGNSRKGICKECHNETTREYFMAGKLSLIRELNNAKSEKSELVAALREIGKVVAMTEDNRKMPHQHTDKELRLNCLAERANEAITKHKELLARLGINN
jgi:hypothetical protein